MKRRGLAGTRAFETKGFQTMCPLEIGLEMTDLEARVVAALNGRPARALAAYDGR